MRIRREDWPRLNPCDVAWVTEWQLASAFPWVPLGEESPVCAEAAPDPSDRFWAVTVRAGQDAALIHLPVRDLGRVIHWCHQATRRDLLRPPALIRASLLGLREALRRGLRRLDPLDRMGYLIRQTRECDPSL